MARLTVAGTSKSFRSAKTRLFLAEQPVHQLEVAAGGHQLEAELVEGDGVAQLLDHAPGVGGVGNVEGEDEAIAGIGGVGCDWHGA